MKTNTAQLDYAEYLNQRAIREARHELIVSNCYLAAALAMSVVLCWAGASVMFNS